MTDNLEIPISDNMLTDMAEMLPIYPPVPINNPESTVKDFFPDLTESELNQVYKQYKKLGGTMEK